MINSNGGKIESKLSYSTGGKNWDNGLATKFSCGHKLLLWTEEENRGNKEGGLIHLYKKNIFFLFQ